MEKAQLPGKEVSKENRKAGNTHFRTPSLGWTGGLSFGTTDPVKFSPGSGVHSQIPFVYLTPLG